MKVGFTGTREGLTPLQASALFQYMRSLPRLFTPGVPHELHHGDCIGADAKAHDFARQLGWRVVLHPPTAFRSRVFCSADEERPPKTYMDRNYDIAFETNLLIATPRTSQEQVRSGTWATIRRARKLSRHIVIIAPDGFLRHCYPDIDTPAELYR